MSLARSSVAAHVLAALMPFLAWPMAGATDPFVNGTVAVRQIGNDQPVTRVSRLLAPLEPTLLVETELAPGRYVITSFQRACDGNCNVLDPPIDQCSIGPLEVSAGMVINALVSVVPFGGCTISTEGGTT